MCQVVDAIGVCCVCLRVCRLVGVGVCVVGLVWSSMPCFLFWGCGCLWSDHFWALALAGWGLFRVSVAPAALVAGGAMLTFTESLILAQDERWRRA